jgi:hypothetical protein
MLLVVVEVVVAVTEADVVIWAIHSTVLIGHG